MAFTRRGVLAGLLAGAATPILAGPVTAPKPAAIGLLSRSNAPKVSSARALIKAAGLGGKVGFVVADAKTGLVLESVDGNDPMPPASVAKAVTSLYALDQLGPGFRFSTKLVATGPVRNGVLQGDLVLSGGGDPTLQTDALGDMAAALKKQGIKGVKGRFQVWSGALPYTPEIDTRQPDYVGYNPSISGLNLNFNRVHFEWKRAGSDYELGMDARGQRYLPPVYTSKIKIADREWPVYTYSSKAKHEQWTVARKALGKGGSRWLPVRRPDLYAGEVFQTLAGAQGVSLPKPQQIKSMPGGTILAESSSGELRRVLAGMMRYSTNITAEAIGMTASTRYGGLTNHASSAKAMSGWLKARAGIGSARFVDHSGLGGASRISASDMVQALVRLGPKAGLRGLMKPFPMKDANGKIIKKHRIKVNAKTGTLNFVSALAGYMTAPDGTELAFAIFTGDVARRDAIPKNQMDRPQGGRGWIRRSKRLQQQLIERWAVVYGQ